MNNDDARSQTSTPEESDEKSEEGKTQEQQETTGNMLHVRENDLQCQVFK